MKIPTSVFIIAFLLGQSSFAFLKDSARSNEYDRRAQVAHQQNEKAAASAMLAGFAQGAVTIRTNILSFAQGHGGLADSGRCTVGADYTCKGSLCTPHGHKTVRVSELGSVQGATFDCKINLNDGLSCKVQLGTALPENTMNALLAATCLDQEGQQSIIKLL